MYYIDVFIPLVLGVMAISIPQILIKENHPKLERRTIIMRRIGYGLVGLTVLYGIVRYLI